MADDCRLGNRFGITLIVVGKVAKRRFQFRVVQRQIR